MTTLKERPASIILSGIVGSTAYGLAGPNSDTDRLGVFMATTESFLGLDEPAETWTADQDDPDSTLHELGKLCRLALKANPTVSELLWLPTELYEVTTTIGAQLIALREKFLSANYVRSAYLGYARSQFDRMARGRAEKNARHTARLLHQGFVLWCTGRIPVRLDNPQWYLDFGSRVAAGAVDEARQLVAEYTARFDDTPTVLPAEPDRDAIDSWLKSTRLSLLYAADRPHDRR